MIISNRSQHRAQEPNAFEIGQDEAFGLGGNAALGDDFRFDAQDVDMLPPDAPTSPGLLERGTIYREAVRRNPHVHFREPPSQWLRDRAPCAVNASWFGRWCAGPCRGSASRAQGEARQIAPRLKD